MKLVALAFLAAGCDVFAAPMPPTLETYSLDFTTPTASALQTQIEAIDAKLRAKHGLTSEQTAVGVLDLKTFRLAMIRPDAIDYAASVPKIAILLGWFQLNPDWPTKLDVPVRWELGLMIKISDNEIAAKYSQQLGLKAVQGVLDSYGLYDAKHGGGLWLGKHYSKTGERYVDPVGNHSHAATVRQLLRYYLMLEQGKLVSPAASKAMREIFESPDIAPLNDRFVKGLAGRDVQIIRKSGWWENWSHDTAVVTGGGRHYIVVALTHHPKGEAYLVDLAAAVDDAIKRGP